MKKKALLLLALALSLGLTACDESNENDIYINQENWYGVSDSWEIDSYNNFICINMDKQFDEYTQEYTVTLKFKKSRKEKEQNE